ncbi:OB-fold domain-containing protein [Actinomadura sp. NPDC000600]|uniref:Zn-ribbon domain-containing OB-fold protein n=1 Tax=Actinomadura sp. NPDC000600 TaxID=3154262 RepID=UPI003391FC11
MTAARRPAPQQSLYDKPYWHYAAEGELRLQRCAGCGEFRYPPAPVCPECLDSEHAWEPLSGRGSLLSWTVFHRQYFPEIPVPYVVVVVRTSEGPLLVGNLVGASVRDLRHDMPLRAVHEDVSTPAGPRRLCQWTPEPHPSHDEEHA